MHRRTDHPAQAEGPVRRYALTGVDAITVETMADEAAQLQEQAS